MDYKIKLELNQIRKKLVEAGSYLGIKTIEEFNAYMNKATSETLDYEFCEIIVPLLTREIYLLKRSHLTLIHSVD